MSRHHEDLEKSFTEEQKDIFEKFHDCWSEYMSLGEAAIFEYAFKLGMQIAIETLTKLHTAAGLVLAAFLSLNNNFKKISKN